MPSPRKVSLSRQNMADFEDGLVDKVVQRLLGSEFLQPIIEKEVQRHLEKLKPLLVDAIDVESITPSEQVAVPNSMEAALKTHISKNLDQLEKQRKEEMAEDHWCNQAQIVPPRKVIMCLSGIYVLMLAVGCAFVYGFDSEHAWQEADCKHIPSQLPFTVGDLSLAYSYGIMRSQQIQSSICVVTAFLSVIACVLISSLAVLFKTETLPPDFLHKGTLSNVCQDTGRPRGRLFTAGLSLACMLCLVSMYASNIYRSALPSMEYPWNIHTSYFQHVQEVCWRYAWIVLPQAGFIFVAVLPSYSDQSGYNQILSAIHMVCALGSMSFMVLCEAIQLGHGEDAFSKFFVNEWLPDGWPPSLWLQTATPLFLTSNQRWRVVVVIYAFAAILVFLSVQIYFGLHFHFGLGINQRTNAIALVSYFGEVTALVLVYLLPCLAAAETLSLTVLGCSPMFDAYDLAGGSFFESGWPVPHGK